MRVDARQLREVLCGRHRSRSCRTRGQPPEPLRLHRRVARGLNEPRRHCSTNRSTRRTRTGVQRQPRLQSEAPTTAGSAGDGDVRRRRSHRSLCSYNAQAAGCTSAPAPTTRSAMVGAQRPFAHFPASESVVTADSWAGRTEDRWGAPEHPGRRLIRRLPSIVLAALLCSTFATYSHKSLARRWLSRGACTTRRGCEAWRTKSHTCMEAR